MAKSNKGLPSIGLDDLKASAPPATAEPEQARAAERPTPAPRRQRSSSPPSASTRPKGTKIPPTLSKRDTQLSVILPEYAVEQVKDRSRQGREPLRVTVLRALAQAGYDIDPADIIDRRVEAARIRSELYRQFKERGE